MLEIWHLHLIAAPLQTRRTEGYFLVLFVHGSLEFQENISS